MYRADALKISNSIDAQICNVISLRKNFIVEAGAGSGKTYSLMKVIDWLQDNRALEFYKKGAKVACITFTNAAVTVINSRLRENTFIVPSTIHSFAWAAMKQFQTSIITFMNENGFLPKGCVKESVKSVNYTLGIKYFDDVNSILYLGHTDIIKLFSIFLQKKKFRDILYNKYPVILIDEYQDSNREIVENFLNYFVSKNDGIQFVFFGDSWQTIYQANNACGLIKDKNLEVIKKSINFRSTQKIVDILNFIRPDLPQNSALSKNDSKIFVIATDDYKGERRNDKDFKDDLPPDILEDYVDRIKEKIIKEQSYNETLKVLMLTHRILAYQQGYTSLFEMLGDGLKNADDDLLCYVRDFIEPLRQSIISKNIIEICEILKANQLCAIQKKSDKKKWTGIISEIEYLEDKSIFEVLTIFKTKLLLEFPKEILFIYSNMKNQSKDSYQNTNYSELSNVEYSEFIKAANFISVDSLYSTDHGVKGEEYDSVLFVIGRGWNWYQFDKYMPLQPIEITEANRKAYERNRNLFYVCCSRAKKNLFLFVTIPLEDNFKKFLSKLVGKENIISYSEFLRLD